jgi:hypothetical protein
MIETMETSIVIIYESKQMIFLCNLISRWANYRFTHNKQPVIKAPYILPLGSIILLYTVKDLFNYTFWAIWLKKKG